jgi:hypothetical protein
MGIIGSQYTVWETHTVYWFHNTQCGKNTLCIGSPTHSVGNTHCVSVPQNTVWETHTVHRFLKTQCGKHTLCIGSPIHSVGNTLCIGSPIYSVGNTHNFNEIL